MTFPEAGLTGLYPAGLAQYLDISYNDLILIYAEELWW